MPTPQLGGFKIQDGGWGPCAEAAHGTAIQDGGWGPCTAKLLGALPSGALSSTTTLDGGELCPLPSLPFSTEETHIKQPHPPACKGSVCTLKQKSNLSIFDRKLNFPFLGTKLGPFYQLKRHQRRETLLGMTQEGNRRCCHISACSFVLSQATFSQGFSGRHRQSRFLVSPTSIPHSAKQNPS